MWPKPQPMHNGRSLCLLGLVGALGCGRVNYDLLDMERDAGGTGAIDAGFLLQISCTPLVPVSPEPPLVPLIEPGLRVDGRTLFARFSFMRQETSRSSNTAPFNDWATTTSSDSIPQDPSFIEFGGVELGAGAVSMANDDRYLILCNPPFDVGPCSELRLFDEAGARITESVDGPTLAVRDGGLVMAFNIDTQIYSAIPRDADLTDWDAKLVDMGPGSFDDPTLSNDGSILLAEGEGSLFMSQWNGASQTYVGTHTVGLDGSSPEIGSEVEGGFEVFVALDSRGIVEPHRTDCALEPLGE